MESKIDPPHTINAHLRERYLNILFQLQGSKCQLMCHEKTAIQGTFESISPTSDYIILSQVKTPANYIEQCAVRLPDVIKLTWIKEP